MSSTLTRDTALHAGGRGVANHLLVLWQHPGTREIAVIGRLHRDADEVEFVYTVGASRIEGFRPLPGLLFLNRVYRSPELPLVFSQRTLHRSRPDFGSYVSWLGLEPDAATPWEQIVRSGGRRQGDTIQVMPEPEVRAGRAHATFLGNGVRWISRNLLRVDGVDSRVSGVEQELALRALRVGDSVRVSQDVGNPVDQHACLLVAGSTPIARVPRVLSRALSELEAGGPLEVRVAALGDPDGSPHLRVTFELDTPAPADFTFDRDGLWQPLH